MEFLQSFLANFLGSLSAGVLLSWLLYFLVTRPLEILRPAKERKAEIQVMLGMLAAELGACAQISAAQQETKNDPSALGQLPCHAWDAARESALFRFLPMKVVAAVFDAYWKVSMFNRAVTRVEDILIACWTGGEGRGGAEILYRNLKGRLPMAAANVHAACRRAHELVEAEIKD